MGISRSARPSLPALLSLAALLACRSAAPRASSPLTPPEAADAARPTDAAADAASLIRGDAVLEDVKVLASDALEGRRSGTDGCHAAAEYLARRFEAIGLKPAGDEGYLQRFEITVGVSLGTANRLRVEQGAAVHDYGAGEDFVPFSFAATTEATGPVVFAGYGITAPEAGYDDYRHLDVAGKIVLVLQHEPRERDEKPTLGDVKPSPHSQLRLKVGSAKERGALGVLVVTDPLGHEGENDDLLPLGRSGGDAGIPVVHCRRAIVEEWLRVLGKDLASVQRDLDEKLTGGGFDVSATATVACDVRRDRRATENVLGYLPGNDPSLGREVLVIGAHYDHLGRGGEDSLSPSQAGEIHNGADDNASGTAALLGLAEAFATMRESVRRTILFAAFSGEEEGLLGSSHYVRHPRFPIADTVAMINMDMVGRLRNDALQIGGVGTSPTFEPLLKDLNEGFQFTLRLSPQGIGPSDHTSFYLQKLPVLFFFTGIHSDYHRPSDDAEKIEPAGIEKVARFAFLTAARVNAVSGRPAFTPVASPVGSMSAEEGRSGYGPAYLGSIPDFAESSGGVLLQGVTDGSPAEKAGLKAGDRIVRFDGRSISSLEDYTAVLRRKRPGDIVELVVQRGGTEVTLRATLGRRK